MAEIEITRSGNNVRIKDVTVPQTHQLLDFTGAAGSFYLVINSDGQAPASDDSITIYHRSHPAAIGNFKASEFAQPTGATVEDLQPLLSSLMGTTISGTSQYLLQQIQLGNLPAGDQVLITDVCDGGAWAICTSPSTISTEVEGIFLNCDWNSEGDPPIDYADVELCTGGIAYSGNNWGQWSPTFEGFTVTVDDVTGFQIGGAFSFGMGFWIGAIFAISGNTLQVISTAGDQPAVGDSIQGSLGGDSIINNVGQKNSQGAIVAYMDQATQKEYTHYICVDAALTNIFAPPQNQMAYVALPRRAQVVEFTGPGTFMIGEEISNGTNWSGFVAGNIPGKVVVSVRRSSAALQVGATITSLTQAATVDAVTVADALGYRPTNDTAELDIYHTDSFTRAGWLQYRSDGDNSARYSYKIDQAMGGDGFSIIPALPWGSNFFTSNHFNEGKYFIDNPMSPLGGVTTDVFSYLAITVAENSGAFFIEVGKQALVAMHVRDGAELSGAIIDMKTENEITVEAGAILRNLTVGIGASLDLLVDTSWVATGVYITPGEVVSETITSDVTNVTFP